MLSTHQLLRSVSTSAELRLHKMLEKDRDLNQPDNLTSELPDENGVILMCHSKETARADRRI